MPDADPDIEKKSLSQRQKAVIFILWKQSTERGKYLGTFDGYYEAIMERHLTALKDKIDD